jgi:hypothetical protein
MSFPHQMPDTVADKYQDNDSHTSDVYSNFIPTSTYINQMKKWGYFVHLYIMNLYTYKIRHIWPFDVSNRPKF